MVDGQCGGVAFPISGVKKEIYQALQGQNQNSAVGGIREVSTELVTKRRCRILYYRAAKPIVCLHSLTCNTFNSLDRSVTLLPAILRTFVKTAGRQQIVRIPAPACMRSARHARVHSRPTNNNK